MNPSLLILFFLADNRKYMLSRWDFSVHVFCFDIVVYIFGIVKNIHDNVENKLTLYLWYLFAMCIICFLQRKNTPDYC